MAGSETSDQNELTREFFKTSRVLIVDQNSSARIGLKKMAATMGAPLNAIFLAATLEEAEALIQTNKPNLIFCEYQIGGRYGLDLIQKQRQENSNTNQHCLFILVTANSSQSSVAQAAEEDIDAYILKPYTIDSFTNCINQAVQSKANPNEYLKIINDGKKFLEKNQLDEALKIFKEALAKDNSPCLASYYVGLTYYKKASLTEAEEYYTKGLEYNKTHYKCLVGLLDLLIHLKKNKSAYEIVQRLVSIFPVNPNRLSTVLRLAIQTKNYSDIDIFYQEFLKIDDRNEELVKCVSAALIICAKHFFENSDQKRGVDLIQKAGVTAGGRHFILKKSIETLIQYNQVEEAKLILKRFPAASDEVPFYAASSLLIAVKESKVESVASRGQELLNRGIIDPEVYQITIESFRKIGKLDRANALLEEALKNHPDIEERLKKPILT